MNTKLLLIAAASAFALVACDPAANETPIGATEDEVVIDSDTALDTPIILAAEGLSAGTGELIELGSSQAEAIAFVTTALGGAPAEAMNNDCPMGHVATASWERGLILLFRDDALVGWESTAADLTTGSEIHAGSTVDELRTAYPAVEIQETTTPSHVFILEEGLYGPLNADQTAVEAIRAGQNCDAT